MRLSAKLSLLIIGIVVLLMLTMIFYVNQSLNRHIINGQHAWVERLRLTIAEGIEDDLRHGNVHAVQKLLQNIAADDTIEHVYLTDLDGNLFAHSFTTAIPAELTANLKHPLSNLTYWLAWSNYCFSSRTSHQPTPLFFIRTNAPLWPG